VIDHPSLPNYQFPKSFPEFSDAAAVSHRASSFADFEQLET
jgi:hypothetical protein